MKCKCKTCQTELVLATNETEVTCSRCGRKQSATEIRSNIEEQIQDRELTLTDLKRQITAMQGEVKDSSGEIKRIKELAKFLRIPVAVMVTSFLVVLFNNAESIVTTVSPILGISLIATFILLGKICAMGLVDSIFFSAEDCKEYPAVAHGIFWFLAALILPMFFYGIYKVIKNVNALNANTHRSGKEVVLKNLSRRSYELQNEIDALRVELNS